MSIDLSRFTGKQREAIEHGDGNLQLIACAGAGKTEVLACRVAMLVNAGVEPQAIVAFTFQEKAAAELKQRIHQRVKEQVGDVVGLAEMYVGTIHGFCLELLRSEDPRYLKYEVLDDVRQHLLINRASKKSGLTQTEDLKGTPLRRYVDTRHFTGALDILRESDLVESELDGVSMIDGLESYKAHLHEHAYLDYAGMMEAAVELLETDEAVRARVGGRLKHAIVDEYQDVNPLQERLVSAIHDLGASVCVIGDDDQTIHQWRGSDVRNILAFEERYPEVRQIRLDDNFRSTEGVVETAREFIEQNPDRLPKKMVASSDLPHEDYDICALKLDSPEAEAEWIAETVENLRGVGFVDGGHERGLAYSDVAILLRSVRRNAQPIVDALRDAGIPVVVAGMNNLFETPEAHAARELFYFMAGPGYSKAREERTLDDVREAWLAADLGLDEKALDRGLGVVAQAKSDLTDLNNQKRWGLYSIQRVFLSFLEAAELREERVPGEANKGEVVFYNLGKFSQLISDFEQIHFHSDPERKYQTFGDFLFYQAEDAYDEGWLDQQYANPDAVRVMTVHQAKGMQWPVVFVPALLRNRFPTAKPTGKSVWHVIPRDAVKGQARYESGIEDERRLFYVAMTRSQKYLFATWAPIDGFNNRYQKVSDFWNNILASRYVKRKPPDFSARPRLEPEQRAGISDVVLSFSELKYFFECPYQFKLRVLYGFNAPIPEPLGYGKSLHDALAEIHTRAMEGDLVEKQEIAGLVGRHLHLPFAYESLREKLETSANGVIGRYLADNEEYLELIEYAEKPIEIDLGDGVTVVGRIDLVRRKDTGATSIVDFKSNERAQEEEVTELQLHVYVLGHQALTGATADQVEIYELEEGKKIARSVQDEFIDDVRTRVLDAATDLRANALDAVPDKKVCSQCDYVDLCTAGCAALGK